MENIIERGEIYFVHVDPVFGREMGGYKPRPAVVVSINDIQRKTRLVMVVPGTSTATPHQNVVKIVPDGTNGLSNPTFFQCQQTRGIDQGRMTARPIGWVSVADLLRLEKALKYSLGID